MTKNKRNKRTFVVYVKAHSDFIHVDIPADASEEEADGMLRDAMESALACVESGWYEVDNDC